MKGMSVGEAKMANGVFSEFRFLARDKMGKKGEGNSLDIFFLPYF